MNFNVGLKKLRQNMQITQKEVADFIGVSERVYGYYEKDRFPKDDKVLNKIASYFNVTVDYLIGNAQSLNELSDLYSDNNISFAKRFKKLRLEYGLSQEDLAKKLNCTRSAISGYEVGRNEPSFDILNSISDVFDVSVEYLTCKSSKNGFKKIDNKNRMIIDEINKEIMNDNIDLQLLLRFLKNGAFKKI